MIELNLILTSLIGRKIVTEYMDCFKTNKLVIETQEEIPWTLDGEFGGNHSKVTVKNEKQALKIIISDKERE